MSSPPSSASPLDVDASSIATDFGRSSQSVSVARSRASFMPILVASSRHSRVVGSLSSASSDSLAALFALANASSACLFLPTYMRIMMSPFSVNLIALLRVFRSTCCTRIASPITSLGTFSSRWYPMFSFRRALCRPTILITVAITACGLNASLRSTSLSASTREKSKISAMSACKVSPEDRIVET